MDINQVGMDKLEDVVNVNAVIFDEFLDDVYSLKDYKERLNCVDPLMYVAVDNGQIVGSSVSYEKDGELYVWVMGVKKENRREGIASMFFTLNEDYAKARGMDVTVKTYNHFRYMIKFLVNRGYNIENVDSSKGIYFRLEF